MRKLLYKLGGVMLAILLALPAVAQSKLRFWWWDLSLM